MAFSIVTKDLAHLPPNQKIYSELLMPDLNNFSLQKKKGAGDAIAAPQFILVYFISKLSYICYSIPRTLYHNRKDCLRIYLRRLEPINRQLLIGDEIFICLAEMLAIEKTIVRRKW